MNYHSNSIRTFIGTKNYKESREFYKLMEFDEIVLNDDMCYVRVNESTGFYLQDYYVKDWVDNSMIFLELTNLDEVHRGVAQKRLQDKYELVRLSEIKTLDWGREFFLHDPSGVLWHFGEFK
mgnify:CR=1 FL=1